MILLGTKGGADEAVLQVVPESENHDHRDRQCRNILVCVYAVARNEVVPFV
jgi:hypothetical protein